MQQECEWLGTIINLVGLQNVCIGAYAYEDYIYVYEEIIQRNWELDVFGGNSLVNVHSKCGSLKDAQRVMFFYGTTIIATFTMHGLW